MKICSACGSTYPDTVAFCYNDGIPLIMAAPEPPPPAASEEGVRLGGVLLGEPLDAGFTSVVYAGLSPERGSVAVKVLIPRLADRSGARQAFLDRHALIATVEHPNIVRVLETVDSGALPAAILEHVDGPDLQAVLRRLRSGARKLTPEMVVYVGDRLCSALIALHGASPLGEAMPLHAGLSA
ncbi:MAG: protein kinase, partial [Alphaproteobacteria bacterium]|nr:protein kinase [Alphaproteobacteria bacterium]